MSKVRCGALVVALLVVVGCSSGASNTTERRTSSATSTPSATSSASANAVASLESAVRAYTAAYLSGNGDEAYGLVSMRCRDEIAKNDFLNLVSQLHARYGDARITSYTDDVNATSATASYGLSDPTLNQTQERWVLEDDAWHNDHC